MAIAAIGFLLFWRTETPLIGLSGLFLTGLGVANRYPLILSLAINAADGNTVQAGARATLASGTAILALPLLLGSFADAGGIRSCCCSSVFSSPARSRGEIPKQMSRRSGKAWIAFAYLVNKLFRPPPDA